MEAELPKPPVAGEKRLLSKIFVPGSLPMLGIQGAYVSLFFSPSPHNIHTELETYMTAKDVLSIAQDKMAPRVQRALENVSRESEGRGEGAPSAPKTTVNPMLKGISEDLLAKVQLKLTNSPSDTRWLRLKAKRNFVSQGQG